MFEKCDSSNSKNEWLLLQQVLGQNLGWSFLRGFILKPRERAQVFLKNGTRDFQNSPPFERLPCFFVTISEKFKRFQQFNFETDFLENGNFFQKTGVFKLKAIRLKTHHSHNKTAISEANVETEWWLQNGPVTRNGVLPLTTLLF